MSDRTASISYSDMRFMANPSIPQIANDIALVQASDEAVAIFNESEDSEHIISDTWVDIREFL